ncbi:hypothetical protein R1sor_021356 [Riccia sorocarpa]|uniref:non-specific serine/threonine protein kinase n=1 Tax=Riccia sorocarpa TaxID=122646 RepID=A0ABD3GK66_9MARC
MNMPARRSEYVLLETEPPYYPISERPEQAYRLADHQSIYDVLEHSAYQGLVKSVRSVQSAFGKAQPYGSQTSNHGALDAAVNRPSAKAQTGTIERSHSGGFQGITQGVDRTSSGVSDLCSHISSDGAYSSFEKNLPGLSDRSDSERYPSSRELNPGGASYPLWDRNSTTDNQTAGQIEQYPAKFGARFSDRTFQWDGSNVRNGPSSSAAFLTDGGINRKGGNLVSVSSLNRQTSGDTDSLLSGDVTLPTSPNLSLTRSNSTFRSSQYGASKLRGDDDEVEEGPTKSWAQQTEQSYNIQVALAIRLMAEAELTAELRLFGLHFKENLESAKRRSVEATAHRFWVNGSLGYSDVVQDGFFMIWGMNPEVWNMCNYPSEGNKMPSLESLRAVNPSESSLEVTLVDKNGDPMLRDLEDEVPSMLEEASDPRMLAEIIGQRVSDLFGGSATTEHGDLMMRWQSSSEQLKECIGSVVVPLGNLSVGVCRHRALLFKVLADLAKLPCRITRGCKYCRAEDGASCIVLCEPDREFYVDLIGKPGSLCSPDTLWSGSPPSFRSPLRFAQSSCAFSNEVKSWSMSFRADGGSSGGRSSIGSHQNGEKMLKDDVDPAQCFPEGATQLILSDDTPGAEVWAVMKVTPERAFSVFKEQLDNRRLGGRGVKTLSSGNMSFVAEVANALNPPIGKSTVETCGLAFQLEDSSPGFQKGQTQATIPESDAELGANLKKPNVKTTESVPYDDWEIHWEDITLKEKIGGGSFGVVHRAEWHGSDVAVKILIDQDVCEDRLSEFQREVAIMKRLRHPNIVLFMGAVLQRPNLSIVTDFLPRGSLYRLLHRSAAREQLDERRRLQMAYDVALGMNYLHRLNPPIVHRDLKSPNLLVDKTWTVKVCDFGLSRFKGGTFLSSRSGAGTPEWMAPEVLRDEQSNEKSDVYSFGVVLWELITMQQPWSGMSPAQVVGAVGFQNRRLIIPKDTNPQVAALIEECWANDSWQRPSFASIMQTLKEIRKTPAVMAKPAQGE